MNSDIEIRLLSESDASHFWQLRLRALKEEPESFGADHSEVANTPIADVAKKLQSSDDSFVLGAFCPALAGMLGFYRRQGLRLRHKGTIWGMYVALEARKKGVGRELLQSAIARSAALPDIEELVLTVAAGNKAARQLYLSAGFQTYGFEHKALKLGDRYLDEELMYLRLDIS